MLFRLLFSFQRPSRLASDRLRNLPEPFQPVNIKFQGFFRRADPIGSIREESGAPKWYCSPRPFSWRFVFGWKELPCEVKLYNKTVSCCQCFFFRAVRFLFREAPRSSARCGYNKRPLWRQRLYNFILPMQANCQGMLEVMGQ